MELWSGFYCLAWAFAKEHSAWGRRYSSGFSIMSQKISMDWALAQSRLVGTERKMDWRGTVKKDFQRPIFSWPKCPVKFQFRMNNGRWWGSATGILIFLVRYEGGCFVLDWRIRLTWEVILCSIKAVDRSWFAWFGVFQAKQSTCDSQWDKPLQKVLCLQDSYFNQQLLGAFSLPQSIQFTHTHT